MVKGDELAYRTFFGAYFDRLLRYLLVVTSGDEDAAREALQATFVRVVRHIKLFESEAGFWRWLTVLARSAFTDESRKRRRYLAFLDRFARHAEVQHGDIGEADERLRAVLQRSLADLPIEERQLVEGKYSEQRSVRALAESLQTTEKAVESRLVRIRRKLKDAALTRLKDESRV
jgi:RNA polymerase sigma-70 factor (ECF subfamily)